MSSLSVHGFTLPLRAQTRLGCQVEGFKFRVDGLRFGVEGLRFGVQGSGFRV